MSRKPTKEESQDIAHRIAARVEWVEKFQGFKHFYEKQQYIEDQYKKELKKLK